MVSRIKLLIIHPMDPLGQKIGGIGTLLKGFVKYSPEDFDVEWIGITSDKRERRIGMWQEILVSGKKIRFFPTLYIKNENVRKRIPFSLRFTISLFQHRFSLGEKILEFHRIEPSLPFYRSHNRKLLFIHGNMKDLYNPRTEVKWRMFPWLYFQLEKKLIKNMKRVFVVREDAVSYYKNLYPRIADIFFFMPTWVDEETFYPYSEELRKRGESEFLLQHGFNKDSQLIIFAGRLEGQKDPLLLIETFRYIHFKRPSTKLLIIGTGALKNKMELRIRKYRLEKDVRFLGIFPQSGVAEIMRISDVFILTSGFEGMPMSVLESLACGLPVVSMDVGEVKRVVINGSSGKIVTRRTAESLGESVLDILANKEEFRSKNCVSCIKNYTAKHVLEEVYEVHYQISKKK